MPIFYVKIIPPEGGVKIEFVEAKDGGEAIDKCIAKRQRTMGQWLYVANESLQSNPAANNSLQPNGYRRDYSA